MLEKSKKYQLIPTMQRVVEEEGIFIVLGVEEDYLFFSFRTKKLYTAIFKCKEIVPDLTQYKLLANTYGQHYLVTVTLLERDNLDTTNHILHISDLKFTD